MSSRTVHRSNAKHRQVLDSMLAVVGLILAVSVIAGESWHTLQSTFALQAVGLGIVALPGRPGLCWRYAGNLVLLLSVMVLVQAGLMGLGWFYFDVELLSPALSVLSPTMRVILDNATWLLAVVTVFLMAMHFTQSERFVSLKEKNRVQKGLSGF